MATYAGSADERVLLSLPVKKGSLATSILSAVADLEFANSRSATEHLFELRNNQDSTAPMNSEQLKTSRKGLPIPEKNWMKDEGRRMKGASSWLPTLPSKSEILDLNKSEFYEALSLRNCWTPKYLPSTYPCCKRFDVDHAMSCMKSGTEAQRSGRPVGTSSLGRMPWCWGRTTRLDLDRRSFCRQCQILWWSSFRCQCEQRTFFDVWMFDPFAKSHLNQKLDTTKRRHYNHRIIEVEHGSFSPLVFSPYGGNSREAERFLTELAVKRSQKKKTDYSIGIHWLWAILFKINSVMCKRLQNNQIWVEHWF